MVVNFESMSWECQRVLQAYLNLKFILFYTTSDTVWIKDMNLTVNTGLDKVFKEMKISYFFIY